MKTLRFILTVAATVVAVATQQYYLAAIAAASLVAQTAGLFAGGGVSKPELTESSLKTERPPRVRAYGASRLYGASIAYEVANGSTIDVYAFHDGRAAAVLRTYLNDNQVTVTSGVVQALDDKSYQHSKVKVGYTLGETPGTPHAAVTALLPEWSASHRGDGVVTGYLIKGPEKSEDFLETYPQGDNVALSLVAQWTPVFDPRDPAQDPDDNSTWQWSDNAVLATVHYLMTQRGYDWEQRFAPQLAKLITAINVADETMTLAAGGTEKRYRTALSYKATETPANVIASLLACCDGWYSLNEAGHVIIYAGAYYAPTVSIGSDQIVAYRHQNGVEDENVVNSIAVPYVSDQHDYNTVDGQPWTDEDDIATRGRENTAELGAVVPSHTQGRRLAKVKMARANAADRGTVTTTYTGAGVIGERFINLLIEEAGAVFFDGVAEVVSVTRNEQTGGTTFDWVAADPNAYAWNPATEDGDPAPVTTRLAVTPLATPVITSAVPELTGTTARVRITVPDPGVPEAVWYARWRQGSAGVWNEQQYQDLDPSAAVQLLTAVVPNDGTVQVEVRYGATDGRLSDWSAPLTVSTLATATFDFTGGTLPSGATLTRAGPATYTSNSGTLATAAADVARFDYAATSPFALRGLLVEAAATNVALYSQDLTQAAWTKLGVTATATRLVEGTTTGAHQAAQTQNYTAGKSYPHSVDAKLAVGTRYLVQALPASAFGSALTAKFDLTGNGAVITAGTSAGVTATIERAPGGGFRCIATATATATASAAWVLRLHNTATAGTGNYTGDGSGALDLTNAQVEEGARASSRIVTTTATVERKADVVTIDWGGKGVPDGAITATVTFDDGSTQTVGMTVASGKAVLPTALDRPRVRSVTTKYAA